MDKTVFDFDYDIDIKIPVQLRIWNKGQIMLNLR
jgi:hypothetical protein